MKAEIHIVQLLLKVGYIFLEALMVNKDAQMISLSTMKFKTFGLMLILKILHHHKDSFLYLLQSTINLYFYMVG